MTTEENSQEQAKFRSKRWPFTQSPNVVMLNPRITPTARIIVYHALLSFAWGQDEGHPSQETLSEVVGVSDRQIRTLIRELEGWGLITAERRGVMRTNVYWIEDIPEDFSDRKLTSSHDRKPSAGHDRKLGSGEVDALEEDTEEEDNPPARGAGMDVLAEVQARRAKRKATRKPSRIRAEPDPAMDALDPPEPSSMDEDEPAPYPASYGRGKTWLDKEPDGSDWRTNDLTYYMAATLRDADRPLEVSIERSRGNIAKWLKEGIEARTIKKMIDLAIADPDRKISATDKLIRRRAEYLAKASARTADLGTTMTRRRRRIS